MDASYDIAFPHPRHCPTKAEIISSKASIKSLEREIEILRKRIKELQNRIQPLQRRKDNHASYISPLRCLPSEILSYVIQLCLDNGVEIAVLTQICGTIRDLVNGLSPIWSRIGLGDPESYPHFIGVCHLPTKYF
jgi:hypothetical protein